MNAADALGTAGIAHRIRRDWGRMYVEADSPLVFDILSRVFGVQSVSPVRWIGESPTWRRNQWETVRSTEAVPTCSRTNGSISTRSRRVMPPVSRRRA